MSTPDPELPAAGDRRTQWLMRFRPWLEMLARTEIESRLQAKFSASDAVQQTLMEAWRCWDQFRGTAEAQRMAWLRKILAFQLAHLQRQYAGTEKRYVGRELSLERSLAQSSVRLEQLLAANVSSPSQQLEGCEQQLQLAEVLARLPEDYRQVIILRNLEDLPHEEVAQRMGRTPGAVRMLWVRALARLRDELGESGTGDREA